MTLLSGTVRRGSVGEVLLLLGVVPTSVSGLGGAVLSIPQVRVPVRAEALLSLSLLVDEVEAVDVARDVAEDGQEDVDQELWCDGGERAP